MTFDTREERLSEYEDLKPNRIRQETKLEIGGYCVAMELLKFVNGEQDAARPICRVLTRNHVADSLYIIDLAILDQDFKQTTELRVKSLAGVWTPTVDRAKARLKIVQGYFLPHEDELLDELAA